MMASVVGQSSIPVEKYVFRYQYLLVEIGAYVLREIFEVKVGRDFVNYLATNTTASNTLNKLMTGKNRKITIDQEKLLPPVEKNPSSASYDITLLCLLLRNVCGLCPAGDPVWMNPSPTDHRVEADITRLRNCRNELQHRGTVSISQTEFTAKWNELCQILFRLNNVAGIPHLQSDIHNAEHIALDAKLEKQFNKAMKEWADSEHKIDEIWSEVTEVKTEVTEVKTEVTGVKSDVAGVKSEVTRLKSDVAGVKSEVVGVKSEVTGVKGDVAGVKSEIHEVKSDVAIIKQKLAQKEIKQHAETSGSLVGASRGTHERKHEFEPKTSRSRSKFPTEPLLRGKCYYFGRLGHPRNVN